MQFNTLGERARCVRRLWGLTQTDIHKAGGPSRTTLFRIENDESKPEELSESTLQNLARVLKCNRQWLESGKGPVWADGIIPPQIGAYSIENPDEHQFDDENLPDPELKRYITHGETDWAIVAIAVEIVRIEFKEAINKGNPVNLPDIA